MSSKSHNDDDKNNTKKHHRHRKRHNKDKHDKHDKHDKVKNADADTDVKVDANDDANLSFSQIYEKNRLKFGEKNKRDGALGFNDLQTMITNPQNVINKRFGGLSRNCSKKSQTRKNKKRRRIKK